jgi:hypothetical protein
VPRKGEFAQIELKELPEELRKIYVRACRRRTCKWI